ncbi:hypothetical protein L917_16704, partial [Phytophthora nicotianae]
PNDHPVYLLTSGLGKQLRTALDSHRRGNTAANTVELAVDTAEKAAK